MSDRVALLSLHSHGDRSFLDDRVLALVAGDLRSDGVAADLIRAGLDGEAPDVRELAASLEGYDVVVYERVWSPALMQSLRAEVPATFVSCEGEHRLEEPPADYVCAGDLRATVPALVAHLSDGGPLPRRVRARTDDGWREGLGAAHTHTAFAPVLQPIVVGRGVTAERRTFSIEGNAGCPYGSDARDNPAYEGVVIPEGLGRGCAFCTTGNRSESAPATETAHKVMTQLRYLRREAPALTTLVLKDQNPFGWLTEVVERCASEGLGGFSLLLETRADWFMRNRVRFDRALAIADDADITLCPFLVGIENFSQPELDRYNKGTTAAANEAFLEALLAWDAAHAALDLSHAAFGFVLLSPWTRMSDLRANLEAVERTGFHQLRGHLLVSKARLYPDTALYYLAERDGLLRSAHARESADNARRYGYFPEQPWRFVDPTVARFAELAAELTARRGGHDELATWRALLDSFEAAEHAEPTLEDIARRVRGRPDPSDLRRRFATLVRPLALDASFAAGWRFGSLTRREGGIDVRLEHVNESPFDLHIVLRRREPGARSPAFARSRHYALRHSSATLTPAQTRGLRAVCAAIVDNDR